MLIICLCSLLELFVLGNFDQPFLMPIEDVFSISGRGTVATGRVSASSLVQQQS